MAYKKSEKMVERMQARRARFLDTAISLFGRLGYHLATVPMIVAEAQSSTGAFYLYFRNKEDVYAASLEEIGKRLAAALNEAIERESTPETRMGAAVEGLVRWLAGNPPEARILMEAATLGGRLEEARRAIIESHANSVVAALELAAPSVDAQDRSIVARCWVGAVLEAAMGWLSMPEGARPEAGHLASSRGELQSAGRERDGWPASTSCAGHAAPVTEPRPLGAVKKSAATEKRRRKRLLHKDSKALADPVE